MAGVEHDVPDRRGVGLRHDDVRVLAEIVEAVRRHVHRQVDLARLDRREPRLGLDDRHVDRLADLGRAAPVVVVPRQHDLDPGLPRLELERTRPDRVLDDVLAPLLERLGAVDVERVVREVLQERRQRSLEPDLHGRRVHDLDACHVAEEALHVRVRARLVERALARSSAGRSRTSPPRAVSGVPSWNFTFGRRWNV